MQKKDPNILLFAIFTTVTIFIWIGFEVYKILTPHTLESIPDSVLLPLEPKLDLESLKKLEARRNFSDSELRILEEASPSPKLE